MSDSLEAHAYRVRCGCPEGTERYADIIDTCLGNNGLFCVKCDLPADTSSATRYLRCLIEVDGKSLSEAVEHIKDCASYASSYPHDDMPAEEMEVEEEYLDCPEHGRSRVRGHSTVGPAYDPYSASLMECGHKLICFGPGDPMTICGQVQAGDFVPERYR